MDEVSEAENPDVEKFFGTALPSSPLRRLGGDDAKGAFHPTDFVDIPGRGAACEGLDLPYPIALLSAFLAGRVAHNRSTQQSRSFQNCEPSAE
jgi:hypothetical protein